MCVCAALITGKALREIAALGVGVGIGCGQIQEM